MTNYVFVLRIFLFERRILEKNEETINFYLASRQGAGGNFGGRPPRGRFLSALLAAVILYKLVEEGGKFNAIRGKTKQYRSVFFFFTILCVGNTHSCEYRFQPHWTSYYITHPPHPTPPHSQPLPPMRPTTTPKVLTIYGVT